MIEEPEPNSVTIIGAGAVGLALADFFREKNSSLLSVFSSKNGTLFDGGQKRKTINRNLPSSDAEIGSLVFITTPDDVIAPVSEELAQKNILWAGRSVVHCSGNLTSDECTALAKRGALTASMHPIQTFKKGDGSARFRDITISLEGTKSLTAVLAGFVHEMGATPLLIDKSQKRALHIAAVFASNYLVSLLHTAESYLEHEGIENGLDILKPLVQQSIKNIFEHGTVEALTGPVSRGDLSSVRKHIDTLSSSTELKNLYRVVGKQAVEIVKKRGHISHHVIEEMLDILGR